MVKPGKAWRSSAFTSMSIFEALRLTALILCLSDMKVGGKQFLDRGEEVLFEAKF